MAERFASVSEDELCEKCIIKQFLNSVFAWYHELSKPRVCVFCLSLRLRQITQTSILINRGYYTVARRYEFYFRVAKQYFTNERSEWVKSCFCHEKIKFISLSRRVMFFLLYRHTDDGVFDDFPKISEDFPKLFRIPDERFRTFSENFQRCPKIAEDFRGRPEDVSMIYQRI